MPRNAQAHRVLAAGDAIGYAARALQDQGERAGPERGGQLLRSEMNCACAGFVTAAMLKKGRRYAILGITAVAAVLSPPDPFSMLAMMLPTIGLYEVSIWAVGRVERQQAAKQASTAT